MNDLIYMSSCPGSALSLSLSLSLTHLLGHHGCLYSVRYCINPCCHAEIVQSLVLLPDGILGINPCPLCVALLQCLLHLGLLLFLVLLTLLCCSLHLLRGELEGGEQNQLEYYLYVDSTSPFLILGIFTSISSLLHCIRGHPTIS